MALSCGCEIERGQPVPPELLKTHYKHTLDAIIFWDLICRLQTPVDSEKALKLSQAGIDLTKAIDELFPEARVSITED